MKQSAPAGRGEELAGRGAGGPGDEPRSAEIRRATTTTTTTTTEPRRRTTRAPRGQRVPLAPRCSTASQAAARAR